MSEQISQQSDHAVPKEETSVSLAAGETVHVTGTSASEDVLSAPTETQTETQTPRFDASEDRSYFALDARIGRSLCSGLARFLSGATSSWYSQPDTCQRVYYANHTSHLDILAIWSSLPGYVRRFVRPVAAKDYWSKGLVRPYIANRLFNAILLERQHVKAHQNPIDAMVREMGDRYSIIIFPEGGRQSSGEMAEFKSGLYHICKKKPGLELIPIYIDNMNRILPRGTSLPVPLLSHVTFGKPIRLEENEKKQDFLVRARQAVLDLKELHLRRNAEPEEMPRH